MVVRDQWCQKDPNSRKEVYKSTDVFYMHKL